MEMDETTSLLYSYQIYRIEGRQFEQVNVLFCIV